MGSALSVKNYESLADRRLAGGFLADTNYVRGLVQTRNGIPENSRTARYSLLVANSGPTGKNKIFGQ